MEKRKNYYTFKKESKVALYGAATIGHILNQRLQKQGIDIIGFIDKRAEELVAFDGKPVYAIDNPKIPRDDVIIIIAVKNVFEHSRIAEILHQAGYSKIIYRPYNVLDGGGAADERRLYDVYTLLTEGEGDQDFIEGIPTYAVEKPVLKNEAIIYQDKEWNFVRLPFTILHTDRARDGMSLPISFLWPHVSFARYALSMPKGSAEELLGYCMAAGKEIAQIEPTEAWKENVIRSQSEVFLRMNYMYNLHPDFFIQNAPVVKWNEERKLFNLNSGKHRAVFQYVKGLDYIPVKMSRQDYDQWTQRYDQLNRSNAKNNGACEELDRLLKNERGIPVELPELYGRSCLGGQKWFTVVRKLSDVIAGKHYKKIQKEGISSWRITVDMEDDGFVSRFLQRCGFEVERKKETKNSVLLDKILPAPEGIYPSKDKHSIYIYERADGTMVYAEDGMSSDKEMEYILG